MKRRSPLRVLLAVLAFAASCSVFVSGGSASAAAGGARAADVPFGGPYTITHPGRPGQCMTAAQREPNGKILVFFDPCVPGHAWQQWEFTQSANPGAPADARRVRSPYFNRCLDADNRGGRLTGVIHIYECNTSANQAWAFKGGLGAAGDACVWVAYLCDKKMLVVSPIPFHDDSPTWLDFSRTPGDSLFVVQQ